MGHFPMADWHAHGSVVLFVCLSGEFEIEFADGVQARCSSAVVDAGVLHKTRPNGELMAVFYLPAQSLLAQQFKALFLMQAAYRLDVLKPPKSLKRFERALHHFDLEQVLARRLPSVDNRFDLRICQSLQAIHRSEYPLARDLIAADVNLSSSRFNHLFSQQLNVSYRHYRQWVQLGKALQHYRCANNFTHAAVSAGFADAAHFSNTCKKLLGIAPSSFLSKQTELHVIR